MASNTTRTFNILVKEIGMDAALKKLGLTDKKLNKAAHAAGVLDRGLKGVAGATSNSTKGFAKQAQGLGGLVHVYATVAANVFALSSAYLVLKRNADLSILVKSSETLSRSTGVNYGYIAKQMKEITNGALSIHDAMRQANLALSGGLSTSQLKEITAIAVKAAAATGRSVEESVQRMVQAVVKGEPELVDEFGIILRVGEATEKYALVHNKAASALTTFERQQAIANQAVEKGNAVYKDIKLEDVVNDYENLQSTVVELGNSIISIVGGPISGLASILNKNSSLILTLMTLITISIAKKAIPSLNNFADTFIKRNKEVAASSKIAADKAKANLDNINDGYGHYVKSTKGLAKEIRAALKGTEIPVPNMNRTNKSVIREFAKSMSGPYKKELLSMLKQLDSASSHVMFLGRKITRESANSLIIALNKEEEILQKGLGEKFKMHKDYATAVKLTMSQTTTHYMNELKRRNAITKQYAAQGAGEGYAAGFKGAREIAGKTKKNVKGETGSSIRGGLAGASTLVGGLLGTIGKIGGKLLGWGLALQFVMSFAGPIASAIGLWDSSIGEAVDKLDEVDDLYKTQIDRIEHMEKTSKDVNLTYDDRVRMMKTEISVLGEVSDSLKKIKEAADKLGQTNWFQSIFKGSDIDRLNNSLRDQIDILKKLKVELKPIDSIIEINKPTTEKIEGTDRVQHIIKKEDFEFTIDPTKDAVTQANDLIASLGEDVLNANNGLLESILSAYSISLMEVTDTASTAKEKVIASFNAIKQSSKTIKDIFGKRKTALLSSGPWAPLLGQFKTIKDNINSLGVSYNEHGEALDKNKNIITETHELHEKFVASTRDLPDSYKKAKTSIAEMNKEYNKLYENQRQYTLAKSREELASQAISLATAQIENGNIDAIKQKYEAQRQLNSEKIKSLDLEISLLEYTIDQGGDVQILMQQIELIESRRLLLTREIAENYSKTREELDIISKKAGITQIKLEIEYTSAKNEFERALAAISSVYTDTIDLPKLLLGVNLLYDQSYTTNINKLRAEIDEADKNLSTLMSASTKNEQETQNNIKNKTKAEHNLAIEITNYEEGRQKILQARLNSLDNLYRIEENLFKNTKITNKQNMDYYLKSSKLNDISAKKKLGYLRLYKASSDRVNENERKEIHSNINKLQEKTRIARQDTKNDKDGLILARLNTELLIERNKLLDHGLSVKEQEYNIALLEHELNMKNTKYGDADFVEVVSKELDYMHKNFRKNMQTDAKIVVRLVTEPITAAMNALTSGLLKGSLTVSEILMNTLKAGYDSIVEIIMKKMADNFQEALLSWAKDSSILSQLFGGTEDKNLVVAKQQLNTLERIWAEITRLVAVMTGMTGSTTSSTSIAQGLIKGIISPSSVPSFEGTSSLAINPSTGVSYASAFNSPLSQSFDSSSTGIWDSLVSSFWPFANGGIMSSLGSIPLNTYANGGIATSPQFSIFGEGRMNEAYVPLPDGKSIPATITGSTGEQNINIQVNVDASGNTTEKSDTNNSNAKQLGNLITKAVQNEIVEQSRPGGLLTRR